MALPILSVSKKKRSSSSLRLTLGTASALIGGGLVAYLILNQQTSFSLPVGANLIPQDAVFAVSVSTDPAQWKQMRDFGTNDTQVILERNLASVRDRLLTSNGYDYQQDIQPWVGEAISFAFLSPEANTAKPKPVVDSGVITPQSVVMVLPVKDPQKAASLLAKSKSNKQGDWVERTYNGIAVKETKNAATGTYSATLLDGRFLVIADNPKATEAAIDTFKGKPSLATIPGYQENFRKISASHPFAQFYINVPAAAKMSAASATRPLPAQVLAQLQHNQGIEGTMNLESEGIRLKAVSWLKPNSDRVLAVENQAGNMQNRLPAETLMMLSGGNLARSWQDYVLTSQNNPNSPIPPEQMRAGIKSLTNLDLERDLLSWMNGEFSLAVIPAAPTKGSSADFRAGLMFMVHASDRASAEQSIAKIDQAMQNQYQFKIQPATSNGKPVTNWVAPYGTLAATHGWLDNDVAFLSLGAPVSEKIVPEPATTLASTNLFQNTVPKEPSPSNGQFFLDLERTKSLPLPILLSDQQAILAPMRSIGVTAAVSDSHSTQYDIFFSLKKRM